jgi:hypothetical protein
MIVKTGRRLKLRAFRKLQKGGGRFSTLAAKARNPHNNLTLKSLND